MERASRPGNGGARTAISDYAEMMRKKISRTFLRPSKAV